MDKAPLVRRSTGMRGNPHTASDEIAISTTPPAPRGEAAPVVRELRTSRYARPKVIMGEVIGPRGAQIAEHRDAFRRFMTSHRLVPTQWAKTAGVPLSEIMAFLTGRARKFSPGVAEKLADAAGVALEDLFG